MKKITLENIFKAIADPAKGLRHYKKMKEDKKFNALLKESFFPGAEAELEKYFKEFEKSGLLEELTQKIRDFKASIKGTTSRGQKYGMGIMNMGSGLRLYALIRKYKPEVIVETGVCNGASTSYILLALEKNEKGKLYSIDYPEIAGANENELWEGKGGSVIPHGKTSGWMVPDRLRQRWELQVGKSQDKLPPLMEQLGTIDVFIHDSEHSYECMTYEFSTAYPHLKKGGLLLSHDIDVNSSFQDFTKEKGKSYILLDKNLGLSTV